MRDASSEAHALPLLGGIFVGGASTRMGHLPKGLLLSPDGRTIVGRWCAMFRALGVEPVLVGRHPAYAAFDADVVDDDVPGVGPIGGLIALLRRAGRRAVVAVACDMPNVSPRLLAALCTHPSTAPILAPRTEHGWEPLFARYRAPKVLDLAVERAGARHTSLQGLLDCAGAEPWALTAAELGELRDWDEPSDVDRAE
jgi:molybdopterin-guanine dinucleotide biosynthesis protein A